MTDKEFKRLSRAQLIDVIYQLQLKQEELTEENQKLQDALTDKRLRISHAGNIAKAVLEINDCYQSAQRAADQYLEEIRAMRNETEEECRCLLEKAREEAEKILANAHQSLKDKTPSECGVVASEAAEPSKQRVNQHETQKKKSSVSSHKKTGRNRKKKVSKKKGV